MDPRQLLVQVRIKNVKSGRYLSIQGNDLSYWNSDDASLTIRDKLNRSTVENPQVWNVIQFRPGKWILLNQYSMRVACIRGRSDDNDATVIQYHIQNETIPNDPFQLWTFERLDNGNWYIQNVKSKKCIGPQDRSTANDHYCIQYDKQPEDSYQQWEFEAV